MNDLLPNTDNFFKYLLTIGLLLILFTVLFPIQKQKEVDIEILNQTLNYQILEHKISLFKAEQKKLESKQTNIQETLDHLKAIKVRYNKKGKDSIEKIRGEMKESFDEEKVKLLNIGDSLKMNNIILQVNDQKIIKLNSYFSIFKTYKLAFLTLGILMTFFGFRYWSSSVYIDELKKGEEISNPTKPSFVRHIDFCMSLLPKPILALLSIVLIVAILILLYILS